MTHKRLSTFIGMTIILMSAAVVGMRAGSAGAQLKQERSDAVKLITNTPIKGRLRTNSGRASMKGRISAVFEMSPGELRDGAMTVKQFNVVFFDAPQARISGRPPKSKRRTGVLGMSIPAGKESVRLKYDPRSRTLSGDVPVRVHFPQLDELFPPRRVRDPREDDYTVSRTQRGNVRLEMKFAEPPDRAAARATQKRPGRTSAVATVGVKVERIEDGGTSVAEYEILRDAVRWPIEVGPVVWFETESRLCIFPFRFQSDWWTRPTGAGLAFGMPAARAQWGKADVAFDVQDFITFTPSIVTTAGEAQKDFILGSANVPDCIEVFFVEKFNPELLWGGGSTFSSGTAEAKIITSDGNATHGIDRTHLAHELGHVLNLDHPGVFDLYPASTNTLMCPSGWLIDNPQRNSLENATNVSNPLLTFAFKPISGGLDCFRSADCGLCP